MPSTGVPTILQVEPLGDDRFALPNAANEVRDVVFGGQLLAQMIVAAAETAPDKHVKSIHAVFARPARTTSDLELQLDRFSDGRTFSTRNAEVTQAGKRCATAVILLDVDEPDLLRHGPAMLPVAGPEESIDVPAARGRCFPGSEVRVVDGVDTYDPDLPLGPAEMMIWTRYPGSDGDRTRSQAVLAFGTDGYLIGTAMRPHSIREGAAHNTVSTGVVSHTLTFHEPFDAGDWLLIAHQCPYAGRGRIYGGADIYARDGRLVASFVQEAIIRQPLTPDFEGHYKTIM